MIDMIVLSRIHCNAYHMLSSVQHINNGDYLRAGPETRQLFNHCDT